MRKTKYDVVKKEKSVYILQRIVEEYLKGRGSIQVYPIFVGSRKECLEQKEVIQNERSSKQRRNNCKD